MATSAANVVRDRPLLRAALGLLSSAAFALSAAVAGSPLSGQSVRIVQTNAAGDDVHLIDPATQRVVGVIRGIPIPHGVTSAPDGSAYYFSNEVDRTLDVVPTATLRVSKQIPLSARPNNVAITPDGRKVYVALIVGNGVDVVDVAEGRVVKRVPTAGGVHNVYVTPDGRYAVAGMIGARTLTVIDTRTDEPVWSLQMDAGVRPMAFERNPDGSTRRIFVQLSDFHGFVVVDFGTRQVVERIALPELPISRADNDALQGSPAHGLLISPDGRTLWSTSKPNNAIYAYALPDLRYIGEVVVGHHPDWLTITPDGRFLYVANAGSNNVSVVDTRAMSEVMKIQVGNVPKRNHTAVLGSVSAAEPQTMAGFQFDQSEVVRLGVRRPGTQPPAAPTDFRTYLETIEPIFFRPRGGHGPARSPCVTCHVHSSTPLQLEPLQERADGSVFWSEEQSRWNYAAVRRLVTPGQPDQSRLLLKPLATPAGGTSFHVGGKFWTAKTDPEWQTLDRWVRSLAPTAPASAAAAAPTATLLTLDFPFFQTCVQRIFQSKRPGKIECVHCHGTGGVNFARTIPEGRSFWNEEESRQNFDVIRRYVEPGEPLMSRFLTHPLAPDAGGDPFHGGGRRWPSMTDPEWLMLAAWVRGERPSCQVG